MNDEFKENVIINLTFEFALKIIDFCDDIEKAAKAQKTTTQFRMFFGACSIIPDHCDYLAIR